MTKDRNTIKDRDTTGDGAASGGPTTGEAAFHPFADDAAVLVVGGLSLENGRDGIAVHGALDLTRDRTGLARARALKAVLDGIVAALEGPDLPEAVAEITAPARRVKNPFA